MGWWGREAFQISHVDSFKMSLSHVSIAYFPKFHMSNLRKDHAHVPIFFNPHVSCH